MALESPKYEYLNEKDTKEMLELFKGERTGFVLVGPKKWFFPYKYTTEGKGFYNFKARPDDTWVLSYPRSGTTWTQELIWLLSNDLDFNRARTEFLTERFPFFEFSMFNHSEVTRELIKMNEGDKNKVEFCKKIAEPGYEVLAKLPSKRFIKSHFPFSLLPNILDSGCKIVYVARNPKDVAVSWYYLNIGIKTQGYIGDFPTFWNYFQNNLTYWGPYWEHLKEAWANRNHPNVLFMFYEDMQHDFSKAIKKVAKFLGKTYTEEQLKEVADYLNVKNFRNNQMVNLSELNECGIITKGIFVRKGKSGGWQDIFTEELNAKADKWIEENLRGTDLIFPYFNNISNN
ncbi:sulfotransferase 4A1-like [Bombus pyrosoma]|uniref:sulfotransferase 4A1-like n=1 Tax=Bombus pyrosoma TaxID=396416 RepID=UPI001CB988C4|nr:sulfotransferase 4A1-like [Bombus pyrosoma]XP_043577839.1 sulfotransferase 4A1-like [Bombus pyrosoma]XP_043577840.1 sulfotransferase 4A1-like [Bombus pyrosoma]XP_043577841.1 sulfotransferase 4A1-like [Bombus pyrosoma]